MNYLKVTKNISLVGMALISVFYVISIFLLEKPRPNNGFAFSYNDLNVQLNDPVIASNKTSKILNESNETFNFKIVGSRIGNTNPSIILQDKKNNKNTYVLYVGDIINDSYTLVEVNEEVIVFQSSNGKITIKNDLHK